MATKKSSAWRSLVRLAVVCQALIGVGVAHAGHTYGGATFTDPTDGTVLIETPAIGHAAKVVKISVISSTGAVVILAVRDISGNVTRTSTLYVGPGDTPSLDASGLSAAAVDRLTARLVGGIRGTIKLSVTME